MAGFPGSLGRRFTESFNYLVRCRNGYRDDPVLWGVVGPRFSVANPKRSGGLWCSITVTVFFFPSSVSILVTTYSNKRFCALSQSGSSNLVQTLILFTLSI
jgi:hypothetical protein